MLRCGSFQYVSLDVWPMWNVLCLMSWIHLLLLLLFIGAAAAVSVHRPFLFTGDAHNTCRVRLLCWDQGRNSCKNKGCCVSSRVLNCSSWLVYSSMHVCICDLNELNLYVCKMSGLSLHSPLGLPKKFTTLAKGPTPSRGTPTHQWSRATGFTNRYRNKSLRVVYWCGIESG